MAGFQSLDRAIDILFSFTKNDQYLSADDIAVKVGLPRVSVYRYVNTLVERGLLEKKKDSQKYGLGYKLLYFQSIIHYNNVLEEISFPLMENISRNIEETVSLTVFKDGKGIIIKSIESPAHVRVAPPVGTALPANGGCTLEAIVAYLPEDEIDKLCTEKLNAFSSGTITDKATLIQKLKKVKEAGYAYSLEEVHPGAWGVAAPIFDKEGFPMASLGISGPIFRVTNELKKAAVENILKYSKEISVKMKLI